jgi:hypothetical protein
VRSVRSGRHFAEALRALGLCADEPDANDRALADELARVLVRRADTRHDGWKYLRLALQHAGAEAPWARCQRQAIGPTSARLLEECAGARHTSLLQVQHAAAQELARTLAAHTDRDVILPRLLEDPTGPVSDEDWERALVAAVTARSTSRAAILIGDALRHPPAPEPAADEDAEPAWEARAAPPPPTPAPASTHDV